MYKFANKWSLLETVVIRTHAVVWRPSYTSQFADLWWRGPISVCQMVFKLSIQRISIVLFINMFMCTDFRYGTIDLTKEGQVLKPFYQTWAPSNFNANTWIVPSQLVGPGPACIVAESDTLMIYQWASPFISSFKITWDIKHQQHEEPWPMMCSRFHI